MVSLALASSPLSFFTKIFNLMHVFVRVCVFLNLSNETSFRAEHLYILNNIISLGDNGPFKSIAPNSL